ncbi:hypothetical protein SASPL_157269 [Salvia splendens]|uniref:non-specific serine/threonine protein kinase n=1 Tax=Salvia splendens TaxID=180675 RepID=A0A8X8VVD8_SALSN|nr:hypothetical protein SASPL_157269 [Salvia splendens]
MVSGFRAASALVTIVVWLLVPRHATPSDIECLKSIQSSLEDPNNYLASWIFDNSSQRSICKFTGIECWHEDDNKVLNIRLSDMGLKGEFPLGIAGCTSMTGLDLSSNSIRGNIPHNISSIIRFITILDLSSNQFSGEIPVDISNCSFLNVLKLENNQLTGQIPPRIGLLDRIKTFSVAKNQLTGPIPQFVNASFPAESYDGNAGLCGKPLSRCSGGSVKSHASAIVGGAVGGVTVAALGCAIGLFLYMRRMSRRKKEDDPLGNKWATSIKGAKRIKASTLCLLSQNYTLLSMFEKSVSKMNLNDLMKATNDFSNENIIWSGRTGTVYKAVLEDGTSLMVKRLQDTQHSENEFAAEMATLGNIKHRNLVPLLGFCLTKNERLLVYKHIPNGSLHDMLHPVNEGARVMDWPLRLKIGIKAAKGFAYLHHSCNPRIIHRNVSSQCILLDADYEPRISDFGLPRLMNPIDTHLSTFVNGEFGDLGYVAPEYARTLMATPKGDVYSFGVVLLELVTGEKATHVGRAPESFRGSLVDWTSELSASSRLHYAIDESLAGKGFDNELFQFLKIACSCVLPTNPKERPTMFEVYQLLRAVGQRYDFTTEDDILVPTDAGDADQLVELIVARDDVQKKV